MYNPRTMVVAIALQLPTIFVHNVLIFTKETKDTVP